ncbi:hypothetical protein Slala03_76920 [Streptomyces lavendulae subsp. lavendulae]|uniref:hypothetical protein n=1 Tax=Streptomyces lavendulae TaxID=1914 RepID=UPI00249FDB6C|nr:hypothetical protein [Streptomyces lavendulae]GLV88003.1 hypothetical protein Slala03_76920 [Streptomyces lavendulae subsp. lavendulae]
MRVGTTYTRHFDLESRQHELLGLDLGEGTPRRALILGLVLYILWTGSLLALFGLPSQVTFTAYFLPPLMVAIFGTQRSRKSERRWNITYWSLSVRYLALGHRPIICGGRRAAARAEWIPRRARWGTKGDAFRRESVRLRRAEEHTEDLEIVAGMPIRLAARPRLYGPDAVFKARPQGGKTSSKGERE